MSLDVHGPVRGGYWPSSAADLSGLDRMRAAVRGSLPRPPSARLSGLRFTDAGLGMATVAMPASPWWQSAVGVFLAGTLSFVADAAASAAVLTGVPAGTGIATSQLSLNFLRPATLSCEKIVARGRVVHGTASLGLAEVFVEDASGRLLAHGTSRCVAFPFDGQIPVLPPRNDDSGPDPHETSPIGDVRGQDYWDTTAGADIVQEWLTHGLEAPFAKFMGIRTASAGDGAASLTMPASEWLTHAGGGLFGGALSVFADAAVNTALLTTLPAATAFSPLDQNVNFVRPAAPDDSDLRCDAEVVHRGRRIAIVNGRVIDARDKVLATVTESILILPGRPWYKPVTVSEEVGAT